MQSHEFYQAAIDAANAKKLQKALGVSLAHAYRFAKPEEDGGSRNDLDGVEALIDLFAAYDRSSLILLRAWIDSAFERALGGSVATAPDLTSLSRRGGAAMKELVEFIQTLDPQELDLARVSREGAEAVNAIEALFRDAVQAASAQQQPALKRVV